MLNNPLRTQTSPTATSVALAASYSFQNLLAVVSNTADCGQSTRNVVGSMGDIIPRTWHFNPDMPLLLHPASDYLCLLMWM
ncbi:MAG: hypothetical protein KME60_01050 [Cyanomargarita calcarea GSE-NOS-MK-12-04C]|jgi:hypothetical protein|uniref:Uncharacterized protein n=1 Tax=Cyanomargarita calcarea GSE-NOS-MK-12-04C TaxID=2839659 RepID=A0A951QI12_9CYAN|nr:hypothetical protein [Cyanomargarita calcarea GSE-NOS-MK-12-04C]